MLKRRLKKPAENTLARRKAGDGIQQVLPEGSVNGSLPSVSDGTHWGCNTSSTTTLPPLSAVTTLCTGAYPLIVMSTT
jgi:hypothetical protein